MEQNIRLDVPSIKYVRTIHNTELWNQWAQIGKKVEYFYSKKACQYSHQRVNTTMLSAYLWRDTTNHIQWIAICRTEKIQPHHSGQNKISYLPADWNIKKE